MNRAFCTACLALALAGCPAKDDPPTKPTPALSASTASVAPTASASGSGAPAAAGAPASWSGTYTLTAGTLSIPSENKDYAGVKQIKDDPSKLMGDGKIDLSVDATGKVTGTIEGGAGPALVDGSVVDGEIRGVVRRKDPKDDGLTGSLTAKIAGPAADGKLSLADATTAIVREAKISLKKK